MSERAIDEDSLCRYRREIHGRLLSAKVVGEDNVHINDLGRNIWAMHKIRDEFQQM